MTAPSAEPERPSPVPRAVVLHSSWHGLLLAHATPLILVLLGALAAVGDGVHPISLTLLVVGVALEAISLFDFPARVSLAADGITRHCLLRSQAIPWSRVQELRRAPGPRFRRVAAQSGAPGAVPTVGAARSGLPSAAGRGARSRRFRSAARSDGRGGPGSASGTRRARTRPAPGGLVAVCGRRRYLLVDRSEGAEEFDAVVGGLAAWAPGIAIHALRPPPDWPPTWLYRRRARAAT